MKKLIVVSAIIGLAVSCTTTGALIEETSTAGEQVLDSTVGAVTDAITEPVTVTGGSGSQCLAVDVLANDGAFIRRGTAGELVKDGGRDFFVVNGARHDISGINYSVKGC